MHQHSTPLLDSLQQLVDGGGEKQIAIWGDEGKTHLINATAFHAREAGLNSQLYDAEQLRELEADAFDGWQQADLLAVDNIDAIAGQIDWETQFYQVMNAVRDGGPAFLFSLSGQPKALTTRLADFHSRLLWGLQFKLESLDDDMLARILISRADAMGMSLKQEVCNYLLTHVSRRLIDQMAILQKLEQVTLAEKRRISIPLVKQVISSGE